MHCDLLKNLELNYKQNVKNDSEKWKVIERKMWNIRPQATLLNVMRIFLQIFFSHITPRVYFYALNIYLKLLNHKLQFESPEWMESCRRRLFSSLTHEWSVNRKKLKISQFSSPSCAARCQAANIINHTAMQKCLS